VRHGVHGVADLGDENRSTNRASLLLCAVLPVVDDLLGGNAMVSGTLVSFITSSHVLEHFLGGFAVGKVALRSLFIALMLLFARMSVEKKNQLLLNDLLGTFGVNSWDTGVDLHFCNRLE